MAENKNPGVNVQAPAPAEDFAEEGRNFVHESRRYVGRKETIAYVLWDMSCSFNINNFSDRYITNILEVDLGFQAIVTFVNGIWDVVNDVFTGAIVDKTRTRWGKFKPYLLLLAGPGTLGTIFYWILPLIFPNTGLKHIGKFITYFVMTLVREGAGTFRSISQEGLIATITPHPVDRTRLITVAEFFSGLLGEKLPEQIMSILSDFIGNGVIKAGEGSSLKQLYTGLYCGMGVFTALVSGTASFYFNLIARERVMQSVDRPSIKQGIRSIINNKPILLLTLSEVLGKFSIGGSKSTYLYDVLNFGSLYLITGIPDLILNPVGYALVPWFRRHFSTRTLYILGAKSGDILMFPVWLIGCIGGKKHGLYKNVLVMAICLTLWECAFMMFYGVRGVIGREMYNECMDYCEWRNGYRTEGMTSVAKGLAAKLAGVFTGTVQTLIKKWIGYDQTAYTTEGVKQSSNTQWWLFTMFAGMPFLTGMFSIIPILFYDLAGEKKEKMYAELLQRRSELASVSTTGSAEDLEEVSRRQMSVADTHEKL
ncbi:MAG: MFS transporter [Clostridia bacterium]|nr:MFS transporter [Clostridia bacterium]